jgi:hypothetical protein
VGPTLPEFFDGKNAVGHFYGAAQLGVANYVDGDFVGVAEAAPWVNFVKGKTHAALQASFLANVTGSFGGLVEIGGVNLVKHHFAGLAQVGGLNQASDAIGLQIGVVNRTSVGRRVYSDTAQVASIGLDSGYGYYGDDGVRGRALPGQIGLVNFAGAVRGFQIGIYNETDDLGGVQIGLLNVSKKKGLPWSVLVNAGL